MKAYEVEALIEYINSGEKQLEEKIRILETRIANLENKQVSITIERSFVR